MHLQKLAAPAEFQLQTYLNRKRDEFKGHVANIRNNGSALSCQETLRLCEHIEQGERILAEFRVQKILGKHKS